MIEQATTKVIEQQLLAPANTRGPVALLSSRDAKDVQRSRERRYAQYCQVRELYRRGISQDGIAEALGLHHATVHTYIRAEVFPERAPYRLPSQLDPYVPYLHQRWVEGCKNPTQLWREIVAQGNGGTRRLSSQSRRSVVSPTGSCSPYGASPRSRKCSSRICAS